MQVRKLLLIAMLILIGWSDPVVAGTGVCSDTPTLPCIKDYLAENTSVVSNSKSSWAVAEDLVRAGLDNEAKNILVNTDGSLGSIATRNLIISEIARESREFPDKAADFSYIDTFFLENPELARFSSVNPKSSYKVQLYLFLSYALMGQIGEGGDISYVRFNEKSAKEQFKPNATWNALIKIWRAEIETLSEPEKSNERTRFIQRLVDAGDVKTAKSEVGMVMKPDDSSIIQYTRSLIALDELDKAISVSKDGRHRTPYNRAVEAKARHLAKLGNTAEAASILIQSSEDIKLQADIMNKRDDLVSVIKALHEVREVEKAKELATWLDKEISQSETANLSRDKIVKAYREAGAYEIAKLKIKEIMALRKNKCTIIGDEISAGYAVEFYRLGLPEEFSKVLGDICDEGEKYNAWLGAYRSSYEDNIDPPLIDGVLSQTDPSIHINIYNSLAAFHFLRGEKDIGNNYLDRAVNALNDANQTSATCHTAVIGHFSKRLDVINPSLLASVYVANKGVKPKVTEYSDFLSNFLSPKKATPNKEERGFLKFLEAAACFNEIELNASVGTERYPHKQPLIESHGIPAL